MVRPPAVRPVLLLALSGLAVAVAACHHHDGAVAVTTRLDCPDEQGDLRRTSAAADGRSCRYSGPDGQEVTLAYLALDGRSPQDALKSTEAELRADVPAAAANEPGSLRAADEDRTGAAWQGSNRLSLSKDEDGDDDRDDDDRHDRDASPPREAAGVPAPPRPPEPPQVDRAWSDGAHEDGGHDRVHINLPFLHVDADGSGRAHVRTFGVEVNADGDGDNRARVRTPGGGSIDAHDGGAEMRFGSVERRRADLIYMVASDRAGPQGFRSGAYIARGPAGGPLVMAVVRSHHDTDGPHDGDLRDAKRLVNHNVRGARGFDFDID